MKRVERPTGTAKPAKRPRKETAVWPEYFQDLAKVFKALNTVLAFVSSRNHFATTFPTVRTSVEGLLKRPLDLAKVAELKALLPNLIKFAYIPRNAPIDNKQPKVPVTHHDRDKRVSPDFSLRSGPSTGLGIEEEDHVLSLEFEDYTKSRKRSGTGLMMPPSKSPAQTKKLIEQRDEQFTRAVNDLLAATPADDDPVALLQAAAKDHIPVDPKHKSRVASSSEDLTIPGPADRPSIDDVIMEIREQVWYEGQIVHRRTFGASEAREGTLDVPLSETIQSALWDARKIKSLYLHQTTAINAIARKRHVIVSTSTASGKSVIYQVPLLRLLEENPSTTAIFVYPTKALAQDQRAALEQLLCSCPGLQHIKTSTYDGDTPRGRRAEIRDTTNIIFTNFDTIHASILPHEELWRSFLSNLKLMAVDELHCYADLFGSHVAQVLRRFRRVCAAIGNPDTIFISCSATIAKPAQHMKNIFGIEDVEEVTEDGAPSGVKDYVVWDLPHIDSEVSKSGRSSVFTQASLLMRFLMKRGIRVILFCKIRKACELAMKTLRTDLSADGRLDILSKVMPYRGGYSQEDRRHIEREAFSGNLLGIVATNALELGVDIGVLDAVLMLGFPFGIANFRQQAGRAGRRARDSLAILIADSNPLDAHYVAQPDDLFNKPMSDLVLSLDCKVILEPHLQCAAQEMPLCKADEGYFGPMLGELCDTKLSKDKDGWYHPHPKYLPYPAKFISIRGAEDDKYTLVDVTKQTPKILEEIECTRALFEVYEGGVFMHQGLPFIVKEVSHDTKMAKLRRADVDWITSPRDFTDVDAMQTWRIKAIPNSPHLAYFGRVDVVTIVYGFYKIKNNNVLDAVDVETPAWERQGVGFWIDVPMSIMNSVTLGGLNAAAAIHSACHAWMNQFSLAQELRTECKAPEKEYKAAESKRKRPARLIFYDATGKSGAAAQGFDHAADILRKAHDAVERCPCEAGCEECVHGARCKEANEVSSKLGALFVLRGLLNLDIGLEGIPTSTTQNRGHNTIVEAGYVRAMDGVEVEH